jgi:hypothetical protein
MTGDQPTFDGEEQLEAENDFLKMKLMLEKGAQFSETGQEGLPPEIENMFLKNMIEFEKQFETRTMVRVYDRIGCPTHFRPVSEIPDEEVDSAWDEISDYLEQHGVSLGVCSPNVTARELYRFAVEELFEQEMDDIKVPGLMHCFIYDEFHPDLSYDLLILATDHCVRRILCKRPIDELFGFVEDDIRLNDQYPMTTLEFKRVINRFKDAYENLELTEIQADQCVLGEAECTVTGKYSISAYTGIENSNLSGNWKTVFRYMEVYDQWGVQELWIENIRFQ